jgi:hypothetical protein
MLVHPGTHLTTFVLLFGCVEIAVALFDFALCATTVYPTVKDTSKNPWHAYIEHIVFPNSTYNKIGIVGWLANSSWPLAYCMNLDSRITYFLFLSSLGFVCHEICQLLFCITNWQERTTELVKKDKARKN